MADPALRSAPCGLRCRAAVSGFGSEPLRSLVFTGWFRSQNAAAHLRSFAGLRVSLQGAVSCNSLTDRSRAEPGLLIQRKYKNGATYCAGARSDAIGHVVARNFRRNFRAP